MPLERDDFRLGRRQRPEGGNQASTKSSATHKRRAGLEHDDIDSIKSHHALAAEGTITVTGSRLPQPAGAPEVMLTLAGQSLLERGQANLAEALNELPGFRGSVTPAGTQGAYGQGVNFLNAYGLGSNRTLVLVDGQRMVSSNVPSLLGNAQPGTQVDLNAIPAILIDRVEHVAIGGAPVYGTDAIAGTVNVRLRHHLTGLDLRASMGITERGDNLRRTLSAAGGTGFAGGRGAVVAALSWDKVAGVGGNARPWVAANISSLPNPCTVLLAGLCSATNLVSALGPLGGPAGRTTANDGRVNPDIGFNNSLSDGFPGSILVRNVTIPAVAAGGVLSNGSGAYAYRFAPDGSLVAYDKGILYGAPVPGALAAAAGASGGDGLSASRYANLASDLERIHAALMLRYDASDRMQLFANALFYQGRAHQVAKLPSFNGVLFSGVSGALTFRTDNPFLTTQARQTLTGLGYATTFQLSRVNGDLADLSGRSVNQLFRIVAGAGGKVRLGARDYDWQVTANYGRDNFTDYGQAINQQRFVNAANVASVGGQIVCSTTPSVTGFPTGTAPVADPACVPLNLFGNGAPSAAALGYILQDTSAQSRLTQLVVNANLGGSPFAINGNPARFNLGYEYHRETGRFTPDAFLQAGLGRSVAVAATSGRYHTNALFAETSVPLIVPDNHALFHRLDVYGRYRHIASSQNGASDAWAVGGTFAPVAGVELRGNVTRSYRSPSIVEAYSPISAVRLSVPDLCSAANINAGSVPTIRAANCAAFLARYPTATPLIAASVSIPGLNGGNPALRNERADSFTYGMVLRPGMIPGLMLSADFLSIAIRDPIASLTISQIASGCFDNVDFNKADPAKANGFCSLIQRDANGQVVSDPLNPGVLTGYVNGKQVRMNAVEAGLTYTAPLRLFGHAGQFGLEGRLFHLRDRLNDVTGVAPLASPGLVGDPRWQGKFTLRYAQANWGLRLDVNYTGAQALAVTNRGASPNDTREIDHYDPFATLDLAAFAETAAHFRFGITITNMLNRVGQSYYGAIIPGSINDMLGRRLVVTVAKSF